MTLRNATILIACCALWGCAAAPKRVKTGTPDCPAAAEIRQPHMLGWWNVVFENLPEIATLLLEKNANYADSFSGAVYRANGERSGAAGDVDEGDFTLEESADGVRITATWTGEVVEGSCGREIRGSWQSASDRTSRGFILRRQPAP